MGKTDTTEPKCVQLMLMMAQTVYPRLFELMEHNDLSNVTIGLKGANDLVIDIGRKLRWKQPNPEQNEGVEWTEMKPDSDPVFRNYKNSQGIYASVNDMYVAHCNAVMDKIGELEKMASKIDATIERAGKIRMVFTREVLTEKKKHLKG